MGDRHGGKLENITADTEFTTREKLLHSEFLGINIIFIGSFFGLFFWPLCFWFIDVVWQPCRVAGAKRDQLDIRPEQTPQKRNLTGEAVGGKVCVCARTTVLFICIYSVLMSAHTRAPEPRVHNLDF